MLTLTNVNPNASSIVQFFKMPDNAQNSATVGGQAVFGIPQSEFPKTFNVALQSSTGTIVLPVTASSISDLVDQGQSFLDGNGGGQTFYLEPTAGSYNVYFYSPTYDLISITGTIAYPAVNLNQTVIAGSTVNVQVSSTSLTYNELVSELNSQPYLLDYVNVYASNIDQVNQNFVVNNVEMSGHLVSEQQSNALSPIAKQFVQLNIPLKYEPKPTSSLNYTVGSGETLKVIFGYSHKNLLKLPKDTVFVPKKELPDLDKVFAKLENTNPMLSMVENSILSHGGKIKRILQNYVEPSNVDVRHVFSAFDDSDYKEL